MSIIKKIYRFSLVLKLFASFFLDISAFCKILDIAQEASQNGDAPLVAAFEFEVRDSLIGLGCSLNEIRRMHAERHCLQSELSAVIFFSTEPGVEEAQINLGSNYLGAPPVKDNFDQSHSDEVFTSLICADAVDIVKEQPFLALESRTRAYQRIDQNKIEEHLETEVNRACFAKQLGKALIFEVEPTDTSAVSFMSTNGTLHEEDLPLYRPWRYTDVASSDYESAVAATWKHYKRDQLLTYELPLLSRTLMQGLLASRAVALGGFFILFSPIYLIPDEITRTQALPESRNRVFEKASLFRLKAVPHLMFTKILCNTGPSMEFEVEHSATSASRQNHLNIGKTNFLPMGESVNNKVPSRSASYAR
jgi:hypothetical protein